MKRIVTKNTGAKSKSMATRRKGKISPAAKVKKTGGLLTLVGLLIIAALMFWVGTRLSEAENLSDIGGREDSASASASVRDLASRLNMSLTRGSELVLTEAEVNRFLQSRLKVTQGGMFADSIEIEGIWVRFKEGYLELIIERKIKGRPHTVAMRFAYSKNDGRAEGGLMGMSDWESSARFGSLGVPRGGVRLILPAFLKVRDALSRELELVDQMKGVRIEEDQLVLRARGTFND